MSFGSYRRAPTDTRKMTTQQLRTAYRTRRGTTATRWIIQAIAEDIIDEAKANPDAWTFDGGIRDLFHAQVEPVLNRLPPEDRRDHLTLRFSDALQDLILNQKRATYQQLNITDHLWESRRIGQTHPHILVIGEKLGLVRLLRRIHRDNQVTVVALNGFANAVTTSYTAAHVRQASQPNAHYHAIFLVDYDPFGALIAKSAHRLLEQSGLTPLTSETPFNPEILTPEELRRARVPVKAQSKYKRPIIKRWLEQTGGIDGQPEGLAIDGTDWHRLQTRIETRIQAHLNNPR